MTPHQRLASLDTQGTPYTLALIDIPLGNIILSYVEYEVLSHDSDWIEVKAIRRKHKTGNRNGSIFDLANSHATWMQWNKLPEFQIRTLLAGTQIKTSLTSREISAAISGLRILQNELSKNRLLPDEIFDILTDQGSATQISCNEIDALCIKLNS
jgi:hypothetical protein